jgi:hypothetical protein
MGMGSWGHRSSWGRPWRAQRHGSKETNVARREHIRRRTLEVRITFERSRVSPACVTQAYERVVPMTRRTTSQGLPTRQTECAQPTPHVGRRSAS